MPTHDPRSLMLLPMLGLCSCVVSAELAPTAVPESAPKPSPKLAPKPDPSPDLELAWLETDAPHQPLSMSEAAARSGQISLAAGQFAAAEASLLLALELQPGRVELRLAQVEALVGMRNFTAAKALLRQIRTESPAHTLSAIDVQDVLVHERERAIGFSSCDTSVDQDRRPLNRDDDFLAAWNELSAGLPSATEIPTRTPDLHGRAGSGLWDEDSYSEETIPANAVEARERLCGEAFDCEIDEPRLVRLELEQEASVGLLIPHADGSVTVLPDLVHPKWTTCGDDTALSLERFGDLLRVRVVSDGREEVDPHAWALDSTAGLGVGGTLAGAGYYAAAGSSGYNSSGYQSSGYNSSGYQYYGCGGGYDEDNYTDYEPYSCTATHTFERDMFINLASGEVVLDIVRSGAPSSQLGQVTAERSHVRVDACGVDDTLALSWTQA